MTQDLIIAVLLLGLTGFVWTMTLATFSQDRSSRKDPGRASILPESASFTQSESGAQSSQSEN